MIKSWSDITLYIYYEILDIPSDLSMIEQKMQLLAILEDLDIYSDSFLDLDIEEVYDKLERYKFITREIIPTNKQRLELNNYNLELMSINYLELGAFIDLCIYFENDIHRHLEHTAAILYRQTYLDKFNNKKYEDYNYDVNVRKELFNELTVDILKHSFDQANNFRQFIFSNYKSIFIDPEDLNDDFETENLSETEIEIIKKEIQRDKEDAKLGWQYLLLELSNNDIILANEILKQPVIYVFNMLIAKRKLDSKNNILK